MTDVTTLILGDHETLRRRFAALDDLGRLDGPTHLDDLATAWSQLAALLDAHASAEEAVFYPRVLRLVRRSETVTAIGDHNNIRAAVAEAARQPVATHKWRDAVHAARQANSKHMAEEERDVLPASAAQPTSNSEAVSAASSPGSKPHATRYDLNTSNRFEGAGSATAPQSHVTVSPQSTGTGSRPFLLELP